MRHLITLIGPDGSIKTSSDENLSIEERDNNEKYSHNALFLSDIYPSEWWSLHGMTLENDETFTSSLDKIVFSTDIIVILDTSYVTNDLANHKAIQIASPDISKVTDLQRIGLFSLREEIDVGNLDSSIIDCIKDYESYDITSFDTVNDYYEALGISLFRKIHK